MPESESDNRGSRASSRRHYVPPPPPQRLNGMRLLNGKQSGDVIWFISVVHRVLASRSRGALIGEHWREIRPGTMHVTLLAAALVLLLWGCSTCAFSATATPPPLHRQHDAVAQILASIEQRLKSLGEALGGQSALVPSKPAVDLDGLARRLEAVETRLGRIEGSLDTRLNTLSESIGRRHGKEEMAAEVTNRKLETISDKIFKQFGYLEGKLEEKFNKLTSRVETNPTEVQRIIKNEFPSSSACCQQLTMKVASGEARLRDEISKVGHKVEGVSKILKKYENVNVNDLMQTLSNNILNFLANSRDKCADFLKEVTNLEEKVRQICTDLWKRTVAIEEKVFLTSTVTNITYNNILELLRRGGIQSAGGRFDQQHPQSYPSQYYPAPDHPRNDRVITKLNQFGRELDYNFKTMMDAQKQFKDSCKRIQDAEMPIARSIENYLIRIHENFVNETIETKRLLDTFYGTDLQMSQVLQGLRTYLEQNYDVMTGDAKNIFTNLKLLREAIERYFEEFTVKMIASKVTEDLKPILLKFVDESMIVPGNFSQNNSSIFQELEDIITLNKNSTDVEQIVAETDSVKTDKSGEEDEYGEETVTPIDEFS